MDPRPHPFSADVTAAYAARIMDEIGKRELSLRLPKAGAMATQLFEALSTYEDAWLRASWLNKKGWEMSQDLLDLLHERTGLRNLEYIEAEMAWVLRTGARFPTKEGELVRYNSETGFEFVGRVEAVLKHRARALIRAVAKDTGQPLDMPLQNIPAERVKAVFYGSHAQPVTAVRKVLLG